MSAPNLEKERYFTDLVRRGVLRVDVDGAVWRLQTFSRTGRPRSIDPRRADLPTPLGYRYVQVGDVQILAHRLVWLALVGPIPEGLEVNHKDGNGDNNPLANLELLTPSENTKHAYRLGGSDRVQGERNGRAKLTLEQAAEIRGRSRDGEGTKALAREFEIAPAVIRRIAAGVYWKCEIPDRATPELPGQLTLA